jgi:hypothetical protein
METKLSNCYAQARKHEVNEGGEARRNIRQCEKADVSSLRNMSYRTVSGYLKKQNSLHEYAPWGLSLTSYVSSYSDILKDRQSESTLSVSLVSLAVHLTPHMPSNFTGLKYVIAVAFEHV